MQVCIGSVMQAHMERLHMRMQELLTRAVFSYANACEALLADSLMRM